ncbi:MAG: GTP-binding protein, partial [Paenibacillaceae bacterium]|nr:GTP-binding protein [Paenibacillaceae bacterium]
MKQLTIGILAHVDAGKTTLSEGILYASGKIGKPGRVDNKNTFLDTYELEKARGITIFSKQAVFEMGDLKITLLDTPGHVDFSAEMERTLRVLDYAILVISGADGVQGHTRTLWRLLSMYQIPVFLFINKMDQPAADRDRLMREVKKQLHDSCIDFSLNDTDGFYDQLAMCSE